MEIKKLTVGPISENCYILKYSDKECAVIDPGYDGDGIIAQMENQGVVPTKILLTHGHFDHIGAVKQLKEKYQIPVCVSEKDSVMLEDKSKSAADIAPFMAFNPVKADSVCFIKEGDIIKLENIEIKVLETPGHTEGGLCFLGKDFIFTGDTLFQCSVGRTDLYSGDYRKLQDSVKRLKELDGEYIIYPGHGENTTLSYEKENNPYFM